jgi:hemerythrin
MALIQWDESYSVNIKEIDAQHRQLANLINELHQAMSLGQGKDVIGEILNSLVAYTQTHFSTEERLMSLYAYPEFQKHKAEHEALTLRVLEYERQYQLGQIALTVQVSAFLKDWLIKHVLGTDKRYSGFLNGKGVR